MTYNVPFLDQMREKIPMIALEAKKIGVTGLRWPGGTVALDYNYDRDPGYLQDVITLGRLIGITDFYYVINPAEAKANIKEIYRELSRYFNVTCEYGNETYLPQHLPLTWWEKVTWPFLEKVHLSKYAKRHVRGAQEIYQLIGKRPMIPVGTWSGTHAAWNKEVPPGWPVAYHAYPEPFAVDYDWWPRFFNDMKIFQDRSNYVHITECAAFNYGYSPETRRNTHYMDTMQAERNVETFEELDAVFHCLCGWEDMESPYPAIKIKR